MKCLILSHCYKNKLIVSLGNFETLAFPLNSIVWHHERSQFRRNFVLLTFFTILNHDILNPTLGFKSYLNISRNSSTRTLQIQPISTYCLTRQQASRESQANFPRAGVLFGPRCILIFQFWTDFHWSIPTPHWSQILYPNFCDFFWSAQIMHMGTLQILGIWFWIKFQSKDDNFCSMIDWLQEARKQLCR